MVALRRVRRFYWHLLLMLLAACSNGRGSLDGPEGSSSPPPVQPAQEGFSVGGSVSGLTGSGLVLQNNGADDLEVVADGSFVFARTLAHAAAYAVTVKSQPSGQSCVVRNGSGTISGGNVANVEVSCAAGPATGFTVGGTVSALAGSGLVMQLNGRNDLEISSNGSFTFEEPLASGTPYRVTVLAQPADPDQVCTVANGSGTVDNGNITSVRVSCATDTFSIGGTVDGLLGGGMVLQNNRGDDLEVDSNGSFTFETELASGATYDVRVRTPPSDPRQACTVTNGRGTVGSSDITSVRISCNASDFTIGGTVEGLAGSALVLLDNGGDTLTIDSNGSFAFPTSLPTGAVYEVTIAEQPRDPSQTCRVSNGFGVVGVDNVTTVTVRCELDGFLVGGRVRMLLGSGLVLQNNGTDDLAIGSSGRFNFSTPLLAGSPYNVTVAQQPSDQSCEVNNGSGTVHDSDVDNVEVRCREGDDD